MTAKTALHLLCDKYRERIFASDAIDWAIQELVEDGDSDALRRLAAVRKPAEWWEVEPLLRQTFDELGYAWLDEEACYWDCARDVANDMVSNRLTPSPGSLEMYRLCVALKYPSDLVVVVQFAGSKGKSGYRRSRSSIFKSLASLLSDATVLEKLLGSKLPLE